MPPLVKRLNKKRPNNMKRAREEELARQEKKLLSPNGRNNSPQAYKIVKRPQRKQTGPKEAQRKE